MTSNGDIQWFHWHSKFEIPLRFISSFWKFSWMCGREWWSPILLLYLCQHWPWPFQIIHASLYTSLPRPSHRRNSHSHPLPHPHIHKTPKPKNPKILSAEFSSLTSAFTQSPGSNFLYTTTASLCLIFKYNLIDIIYWRFSQTGRVLPSSELFESELFCGDFSLLGGQDSIFFKLTEIDGSREVDVRLEGGIGDPVVYNYIYIRYIYVIIYIWFWRGKEFCWGFLGKKKESRICYGHWWRSEILDEFIPTVHANINQ